MRKALAVMMSALMLAGCTHVYPCDPAASTVDLEDVNRAVADQRVTVTLLDGTSTRADNVFVERDSTSLTPIGRYPWLESQPRVLGSAISTPEIRTIVVTRRGWRGALDWAKGGLGIGAALGLIVGLCIQDDPVTGDELSGGQRVLLGVSGALSFGLVGGGLGFIGGACAGSQDVYDFTEAPEGASGSPRR